MFEIRYHAEVLDDLKRIDNSVRKVLQKKLLSRLQNPRVPKDALVGNLAGAYKVKDSKTGYRLLYLVYDDEQIILVFAVDRRDKLRAYRLGAERLKRLFLATPGDVDKQD